jgi:DNA helicase II / ATP-dependent DNA helicase PcrA
MAVIKMNVGPANKPQQEFKPSKYQQAVYDFIQNGRGSAIIEAVAGSGKTSTIVQALSLIPLDKRAIFLAFNKSIAEELKTRIPAHATASTFHSAGLRAWKRSFPNCQIDDRKDRKIIDSIMTLEDKADFGDAIFNLVSLAKQRGIGCLYPDVPQSWSMLIEHFDLAIDTDRRDSAIRYARSVLAESVNTASFMIDFDDMIYMPVLKHTTPYTYDWVFVDEAQDTNGVRRALAKMMLAKNGRLVAVGDSHQAIYGFTGADSDAMELIQREFNCKVLSLSICYRSAQTIVQEAQRIVPGIEAAETAPQGIVATTTYAKTTPGNTDAILCRNTAPLVNLAYEMISQGRGCRILGRDIGKGLVRLVESMKAHDLEDLEERIAAYQTREVRRLLKENKESKAQSIDDKVGCILAVIEHLPENEKTIRNLIAHIDRMFQDNGGQLLTLSTIHKAKGLEWPRVFIHMPGLMPSRWAKQPWQIRQEVNLQYVAITRAKSELYYVNEENN